MLIVCPHCGKKISDSSTVCIHCQFNLKEAKAKEKISKAFGNISEELQKQYEYEFCCSNKTYKKIKKFRLNYAISSIASGIGIFCALAVIISLQFLNTKKGVLDTESPWVVVLILPVALLFFIAFIDFIVGFVLQRKLRKNNVIYYTEFSRWLKKNKQLELNNVFDKKEIEIYKILYPEGDD